MPKVKLLSPFERVNPVTKQFEQVVKGSVIDISEAEFRFLKKMKAIELIQEQAAMPADVSGVVEAANAVETSPAKARKDIGGK